ncbi:hypothetical protein OIV57_33370, partial [Burkholderia pseudomallei]|uniref:hypothetical protein n=1 Tax=Burkholderia pseudomallei TaxID=28450 RepID=UPI0021F79571
MAIVGSGGVASARTDAARDAGRAGKSKCRTRLQLGRRDGRSVNRSIGRLVRMARMGRRGARLPRACPADASSLVCGKSARPVRGRLDAVSA